MKMRLALSAVLIFAATSSYGSQSQSGYQSQFHMPHVKTHIQAHSQQTNVSTSAAPSSAAHSVQARPAAATGHAQTHIARSKPHTNSAVSTIGFVSASEIAAGGGTPDQALLGDFNGDGKKDVLTLVYSYTNCGTGNSSTYCISAVLSNGNGTFQPPVLTPVTSNDPILIGDVNGDGKADVIQAHPYNSPSTLDIWLSNGDGTFTLGNNYQISTASLQGGILTDVNGDGKLDILAIDSQTPGLVWTLLGNGDGTFQAGTSVALAAVSPNNIVFGDFNGDGKIDFAGTDNNNQVNIYLQSAGTFQLTGAPLTTPNSVYNSCNLTAGDLNADGRAEIVSSNCYDNNLTVYVNNGDGTFQTGVYYAPGIAPKTGGEPTDTAADLYPEAATIADVNGDGKNDIVVSNDDSSDVTILLGNGDGTVSVPSVGYAVGGYPRTPAVVADFNGDGLQDIIVTDDEHSFVYLQGYGDGTFHAALNYYAPIADNGSAFNNYAYGITVATGDFNGDGLPDVVLGSCCESSVGITVFLSRADGSLQPGVNYGAGGGLQYVAVGDFNGDTKLDIAVTDRNNGVVQIFTGNGDGTFNAPSTFATDTAPSPYPSGIVAGDFNHDGNIDLAVVNSNNYDVGILLGDGTGNFSTPTPYSISQYAYEITAADLDGDGYLDLVVPLNSNPSNGVAVLLADSTNPGTFKAESDVAIGYNRLYSAAVGDLNGDGKVDLAVTVNDNSTNLSQGIAVALGNGDGTFQPATLYASTFQDTNWDTPYPSYVKMFDLDGDGKLDLIYTNSEYGTVGVMFGYGDGTFSNPAEYASGGWAYGLALADVNGDGATDVITAGDDFAGVTVLLNNSVSATTVTSSLNPAVASQPITLTATVAASVHGVTAVPTGAVAFSDGSTLLGTGTLSGGVATFTTSSLAVGTHSIIAQYSGSANFHASTSTVLSQLVTVAPDATTLTSSVNPAGVTLPITFTATIAPAVQGVTAVATGTVAFSDGSTLLGTASLSGGVATLTTSSLALGTHSITAQYGGDANFHASTSTVLSQVVTVTPDYSMAATPASATVKAGSSATFTITLTPSNGYNGTVTFSCGTLPAKAACAFSPASLTPTGNAPVSTTLTITTAAATASFVAPVRPNSKPSAPTFWASLSGLGVFGLVLTGNGKKRNRRRMALVLGILLLIMMFTLVGCSGGGSSSGGGGTPGTPVGSYTVQATATGSAGSNSGNTAAHSFSVSLTVQ